MQGSLDGIQAPDVQFPCVFTRHCLILNFSAAALENFGKGTGLQSPAEGADLGKLLALAKYLEEFLRLASSGLEAAIFVENDTPRQNRKRQEQQEDESRHKPSVCKQLPDFTLYEDKQSDDQPILSFLQNSFFVNSS